MREGACQAIEDAAILASLLGEHSYPEAFAEYNRQRIPRTQQIVKQSWQLGKLAQLENPIAVKLRNLFMRSIPATVNQRQLDSLLNVRFEPVKSKMLSFQVF